MATNSNLLILLLTLGICQGQITIDNGNVSLNIDQVENGLHLKLTHNNIQKLTATLGVSVDLSNISPCLGIENCLQIDEDIRLHVTSTIENGFSIIWSTENTSRVLQDCFDLDKSNAHWFGGPEQWSQKWPIEKVILDDHKNVPQEYYAAAIVEPFWLNSHGAYIFVDERVPLFIDQNANVAADGLVCFSAKADKPYRGRSRVLLNYTLVAEDNVKEAHQHAVRTFLGTPTYHPNVRIIENPIWSTWARYKRNINDSLLLAFADEIVDNGYPGGQFEIDDFWETCYGSLTFSNVTFPDITNTVSTIKAKNFTVSLWVHPFVNTACTEYTEIGLANDFFVKNELGDVHTHWWNSGFRKTQHIDFTNVEAREWYVRRLKALQENHGIDSFKFDAGETSWPPQVPVLTGDVENHPYQITVDFVNACAEFGDLIEIRSGWRTQYLGVLVRMLDKDSRWGDDNGLYTLITTLLNFNVNGYTMVLPDMIGGNGYSDGAPGSELFIRWLQANTFMPTMQFSYVPWDYANDANNVLEISRKYIELHKLFTPEIIRAMDNSISSGSLVNGPMWWIDPTNPDAMGIDTQYLLGEDIVVAPVITEGATSRDVFLPSGTWVDGNTGSIHEGNTVLSAYDAPLDILPYFVRQGSNAERINKSRK